MAGEGRRDLPAMVVLVQVLVDALVVQEHVYPVDDGVGEENECEHAHDYAKVTWKQTKIVTIQRGRSQGDAAMKNIILFLYSVCL